MWSQIKVIFLQDSPSHTLDGAKNSLAPSALWQYIYSNYLRIKDCFSRVFNQKIKDVYYTQELYN